MLNKLTVLLAGLSIISSWTANAELDVVTYEAYKAGEVNKEQQHAVASMDVVLNKHIYKIQPQDSKIEFSVDSPIGEIRASFEDFGGSFTMLNTGIDKDPASINVKTASLDTDAGFITMMLRSESFFDVENFPSMRFVGSSFEWINDKHAILKGYMTIKNMTRQVAFYVELDDANVENRYSEYITMKAAANIKRSDFGIHTLLPVVGDDVSLLVSIGAVKKDAAISVSMLN